VGLHRPDTNCGSWRRGVVARWRLTPKRVVRSLAVLGALAAVVSLPSAALADRAFAPRFTVNTQGDITIAANSIMTCVDDQGGVCANARAAVGGAIPANNNNSRTMTWIDADGDPTTFDSSSATLSLPPGSTVLFAGLYYGGRLNAGSGGSPPPNPAARNTVLFKAPGDPAYRPLTASVDDSSTQYQGFVNVTGIVAAAGPGTYTTANVQLGTGLSDSTSGGWALVVAYGDPNAPSRNLSVFDGMQNVGSANTVTIPLSGFQTPLSGPVTSTVGIVAYEGDLGTTGDGAQIQGASGFSALSNAANPANNVFNSTISSAGAFVTTRTPSFQNNLGYDADLFRTTNVLGNGQTSTQVRLSTSGDAYQPGVVTLATDLYAPKITATKTVDRATASLGDTLTYTITLQNTGQDAATGTTLSDLVPGRAVFVPGSIRVNGTPVSDAAGDDLGEFTGGRVVARVGTGATATSGGVLAPGASSSVSFQATVRTSGLLLGATIDNTADVSFQAATTGVPSTVTSAPATTSVLVPDLTIGKRHDPPLAPGLPSTYTITVGNVGDGPTSGAVTVTDTLEAGLSRNGPVTGAGWTCSTAGATITCTRSDALAAGSDYPPISIPVLVSPSANPGLLSNTASLQAPSDGNPDNNSFTDEGAVSEPAIDLHVEKVVTSTPAVTPVGYVSGDTITYRIEVTNNGVADAANVRLDDALDAPLVLDSLTTSLPPPNDTCPGTSCNLGTITPGQAPVIVTVQAHVPDGFENYPSNRLLNNTATVSAPVGTEINPDDNSATATINTLPIADISITKTFSPAQPLAGGPITYTATVHNHGPDTVNAGMADLLPDAFVKPPTAISISGGTGNCQYDPTGELAGAPPGSNFPIIWCDIPQFAPGEERVITYQSTLAPNSAGTAVTNNAFSAALIPLTDFVWDPDNFEDNFAAVTFTPGSVDVALAKSVVGPSTVAVGDTATFRLVASNSGTVAATNVPVTDPLPAGLTPVGLPSGCTAAGQTVTCDAGTIAPGGTKTFDIQVRAEVAAAEKTLTNLATVASAEPDVTPGNNSASANLTVGPFSTLTVTKTANATSVPAGSPITYTITVGNNGPSAAGAVTLTDVLPAGLTLRSVTPSRGSCTGATCDLGNLPAGATAQVVVVVDTDASAGKRLANSVEVTAATPSSPARAQAPVEITAPFAPPKRVDLAVDVRGPTHPVREGGTANFRIDVTNHGPATATSVALTGTANKAVRASIARLLEAGCTRLPLRCDLGTLAPGQRRSFIVRMRRLVPGRLTLTGSVTAAEIETNRANNLDRASVQVRVGRASVRLGKRADRASARTGDRVGFTIVVRNTSSVPARNLLVCDRLPPALDFVLLDGARLVKGRACWTIRRLAPARAVRYHLVTTAVNGPGYQRATNTATVRGANVARKSASASVGLRPAARRPPYTG
jgi:uncharacterized repeat protein (TIGR01451 family)